MAERRMFAKTIIDSDAFLDMPLSTQALYFHLSMRADDDGFVNNPKKIARMIGATEDDYNLLVAKSFVLRFESGVIVIKHWRINNYIQKDRYKETVYSEEKDLLSVKDNGAYTLCIQNGYNSDTQVSIGKDSIGKLSIGKDSIDKVNKEKDIPNGISKEKKNFCPPTLEEVTEYCEERNNGIDPQAFIDFYSAKGWMIGKNKMKDWKAAIRTWENNNRKEDRPKTSAYMDSIKNRVNIVDSWLD